MAKVLVNIISEQAIPNFKFIKEFKDGVDKFIFISTNDMDKAHKVNSYLSTFKIPERRIEKIIVNPFNLTHIEDQLLTLVMNESDTFHVNITGGTKPMSIVTLTFFSVFKNVNIYYIPIGEDKYRQIYPRTKTPEKEFKKKLTLREYIHSFNLKIEKRSVSGIHDYALAQSIMKSFIRHKGDIRKIPLIKNAKNEDNSASDKMYYSGTWFEEYIYWKIKKHFNLDKGRIAMNVLLRNETITNEYDVIFVHKDAIYIVECKAYFGRNGVKQKVEKDLYKLGALHQDFGLKSKPILITTTFTHTFNSAERARSLGVRLFDLNDIINDNFLKLIE